MSATAERAHELRELIVEMALRSGECHVASSLSIAELLSVLYFDVMRDPAGRPDGSAGDRFLLSKGHASSALYGVLALAGVLDRETVLDGYCSDGGVLAGHPERGVPGVEMSSGSLGHGPAVALGYALADRIDGDDRRTFCLLGDGELDEGSVWESLALGGHLGLDGLTLIVDANGLQGLGATRDVLDLEPLAPKLESFAWIVREVDGHDPVQLRAALARADGPTCVVARTVKGRGLDLLEDGGFRAHYRSFRPHERELVLAALAQGRR